MDDDDRDKKLAERWAEAVRLDGLDRVLSCCMEAIRRASGLPDEEFAILVEKCLKRDEEAQAKAKAKAN